MYPLLSNPAELLVLVAACFLTTFAVYAVKVLRGAREGIRWWLQVWARALAASMSTGFAMAALGRPQVEAGLAGILVALLVANREPKRSRPIPTRVRRKVIAQFEAEKGEKFDTRKYHVDHIVPFAKGGSHTEDNLRVIEKRKNFARARERRRVTGRSRAGLPG